MTLRRTIATAVAATLNIAALSDASVSQQRSLAEQLVGTWILASHQAMRQDGSTFLPYGPSPTG